KLVEMRDALDAPSVGSEKNLVSGGFLRRLHLVERQRVDAKPDDVAFLHEKSDGLRRDRGEVRRAGAVDSHEGGGSGPRFPVPARVHEDRAPGRNSSVTALPPPYVFDLELRVAVP